MLILGINAAFHDSAACLIKDGKIIAAVEEERFNRVKHAKRPIPYTTYELPFYSINYCLTQVDKNLKDIDYIAYSFDPKLKSGDPQMLKSINDAPFLLALGAPLKIKKRFEEFDPNKAKWIYVEHHTAHTASAFYTSAFEEAAILTIDGRGEIATTTYNIGKKNQIVRIKQVNMPNSLGILYERATEFLGFLHSSDEGKIMAMAGFGKPKYLNVFQNLIKTDKDGDFEVNQTGLDYFFGPPRKPWEKIKKRDYDIAASLQLALENTVLEFVSYLKKQTNLDNLCLSGGIFLNCLINSKIKNSGIFKNVWIYPVPGDAGTAVGSALWVDRIINNSTQKNSIKNTYYGPSYENKEIETILKENKIKFKKIADAPSVAAKILAEDKIIGWFQGKMEFGPRALGNRSILASPINKDNKDRLNKIKGRENFRPVAPVVLEEEGKNWFKDFSPSSFMLYTFEVLPEKKSKVPAALHIDNTARLQSVNKNQNPLFYQLIKEFKKITGIPIIINTSFNIKGEPIVNTPQQAIASFFNSALDVLIIGNYLITK